MRFVTFFCLLSTLRNPVNAKSTLKRTLLFKQQQKQHVLPQQATLDNSVDQPTIQTMQTMLVNRCGESSAMSALQTRVASAVLMLGGLFAVINFGGEAGVNQLIVFFQVAMYNEATNVVGILGLAKWWWFLTYFCVITAKRLFPNLQATLLNFVGFGMAIDGIVALVLQQNQNGSESFGKALGQMAGCNVVAVSYKLHYSWLSGILTWLTFLYARSVDS